MKRYILVDIRESEDAKTKEKLLFLTLAKLASKMKIVKIKSLYNDKGVKRKCLIPIDIYPCLYKRSGIDKRIYYETNKNKPIKETKMKKTRCKLNKRDMKKIRNIY